MIHKPLAASESITEQYDNELLFLVGDWYHWPSKKVLANFMDRSSTGSEVRTTPDSLYNNPKAHYSTAVS